MKNSPFIQFSPVISPEQQKSSAEAERQRRMRHPTGKSKYAHKVKKREEALRSL
jgi:hypothetical protein